MKSEYWQMKLYEIGTYVEDVDDINQSISIILSTPKGSNPHRPEFGSEIFKYIDYPVQEAIPNVIREAIDAITIWEPRIDLKSVSAEARESNIILKIEWTYKDTDEGTYIEVAI